MSNSMSVSAWPEAVEVDGNIVRIFADADHPRISITLFFHDGSVECDRMRAGSLPKFAAALVDAVTGGTGGRVDIREEQ